MASGDTLLTLLPSHGAPPTTNYAKWSTRNQHPTLTFENGTNQTWYFSGVMPALYGGTTGVTVILHFTSTGTTGDVDWDVAWERVTGQDIDSDGFAAVNSVDGTSVNGTSGIPTTASVTFTDGADMDSVTAGDAFRLSVLRDQASDTSTDDIELLAVEIRET